MAHNPASVSPPKPGETEIGSFGEGGLRGPVLVQSWAVQPSTLPSCLPPTHMQTLLNLCSPLSLAVPAPGTPAPSPPPISSPPAKALICLVLPLAGAHCPISLGLHGLGISGHPLPLMPQALFS